MESTVIQSDFAYTKALRILDLADTHTLPLGGLSYIGSWILYSVYCPRSGIWSLFSLTSASDIGSWILLGCRPRILDFARYGPRLTGIDFLKSVL